jgi:hypothetical protein
MYGKFQNSLFLVCDYGDVLTNRNFRGDYRIHKYEKNQTVNCLIITE